MDKQIYSRTITPETGAPFIDRIQVERIDGELFVTAYSTRESNGELTQFAQTKVSKTVLDLINGVGDAPYSLEQ